MNESKINKYSINTPINKIIFLFHFFGLKLNEKRNKCRFIFNLLWLGFIGIGEMLFFIDSVWTGQGFVNLKSLASATMCILGEIKIICHVIYENDVIKLINDLKELENNTFEYIAKKTVYMKEVKYLNILIRAVKCINTVTIFAFAIIPCCVMGAKYWKTKEVVLILPLSVKYYVFDPFDLKYYGIIYLHQFGSMCICLAAVVAVDILYCIICVFIKIHFKLLQYDFERLIPYQNVSASYFKENAKFKKRFKKLISTHQKLMSCADLLENIHTREFFLNFLTSLFLICLTGFIVTISEDSRSTIPFITFLMTSLQQIFLLCFYGDMVMSSSIDFGNSVHNCNWYLATSCIGEDLCFILHRSQKPCKITACSFMDVNLIAFSRIISRSLSYITVLRTLYNP